METYIYNKEVNVAILTEEIRNSLISVSCTGVFVEGVDSVHVTMALPLASGDKTILDSVVSRHIKVASPVDVQVVEVLEDRTNITTGSFQGCMWQWEIPASAPGHVTTLNASHETNGESIRFPFPISMLFASWQGTADNAGDEAAFVGGPNTPVGIVATTAAVDDSVLHVNDTVMANTDVGHIVTVNGRNLGRCIGKNVANSTISLEFLLDEEIPPMSYVLITKQIARRIYFEHSTGCRFEFGSNRVGGALLPAGLECHLVYKNNDGAAKQLRVYIEYVL